MAEVCRRLGGEWGALVGPLEGAGRAIVVIDEGEDAGREILDRGEGAATEELASQDRQPDLDLVEPGAMVGRVVQDDAVAGVAQEGGPGLARGQDAGLTLDAQVEVAQARELGDPADER